MERYDHRQPARGMWLATGLTTGFIVLMVVALGQLAPPDERAPVAWLAIGILAFMSFMAWLFGGLRVTIDDTAVTLRFGPGWPKKEIPLSEVRGAWPVRNSWWYGWGIRLTPHGWLWNVSGLDAVELELADGRRTRIGTDEPEALAAAVMVALGR